MSVQINQQQVDHYRQHGYVIVENFLDPAELASARAEIDEFLPGCLFLLRQWDEITITTNKK